MSRLSGLIDMLVGVRDTVEQYRVNRRWARLCERGMHIGEDVWLPPSTWIDPDYCFLISIGDHCGFGAECLILAHDAQMDEFIDAARIGRVVIHPSSHIGSRTVILPGVEIGPRTIVGANSVVSRSLPPDTVCAGMPARVVCPLEEYLAKHRERLMTHPVFPFTKDRLSISEREQIATATLTQDGYIVGGRSAELRGEGGTPRTPRRSR